MKEVSGLNFSKLNKCVLYEFITKALDHFKIHTNDQLIKNYNILFVYEAIFPNSIFKVL